MELRALGFVGGGGGQIIVKIAKQSELLWRRHGKPSFSLSVNIFCFTF